MTYANIKVLIVADWYGEIYAQAFYDSFKSLNYETYRFPWKEYFHHYQYASTYATDGNRLKALYYRLQNNFLIGPTIRKINCDLLKKCEHIRPDLTFIYRGTHIYPDTIKKIKSLGCKVFGYNNDDPFSNNYRLIYFRLWSLYRRSIPHYDWIFSYRQANIKDYKAMGYHNVSLLRSYYIKEKNSPIPNATKKYDVIFIGHFEDDTRDETVKYLLDNGINIKLFGTLWDKSKFYDYFRGKIGEIKPLYGDDYNHAINQAKIALVFLSKLNNDTYTRRCFEIPATKTMMLAEYSEDQAENLFKEGKEAEYFRNKEDLLKKVTFYLNNEEKIVNIGNAGFKRLQENSHEVSDKVKEILRVFQIRKCLK
jgi:spore maturation protein CgeB